MKKFISIITLVVMLLSMSSLCFAVEGIPLPDISVKPVPAPTPTPAPSFDDVAQTDWFYDKVQYAVENGIFDGTGEKTFSPKKEITRAEFLQVLANLDGVDVSDKNVTTVFTDVPSGKWYTPAIKWAKDNALVDGVGDNMFAPDRAISRQEMCVMLKNYIAFKGIVLKKVENKVEFSDDADIASWAKESVYACQMADLIDGKGNGIFDPKNTAIRAEAASLFKGFHENYIK